MKKLICFMMIVLVMVSGCSDSISDGMVENYINEGYNTFLHGILNDGGYVEILNQYVLKNNNDEDVHWVEYQVYSNDDNEIGPVTTIGFLKRGNSWYVLD